MYVGLVCAFFGQVWVGAVYIGLLGVCLIIDVLWGLLRLGLWFL